MFTLYLAKVVTLLGGLRDNSEREIVRDCFNRQLSPVQAKQVVINSR